MDVTGPLLMEEQVKGRPQKKKKTKERAVFSSLRPNSRRRTDEKIDKIERLESTVDFPIEKNG